MTLQDDQHDVFLAKAQENLTSARSELANQRFNACANRCYYACIQAAIAALLAAGVVPTRGDRPWGHGVVQAQFSGLLINRRKLYPPELRNTLPRLFKVRRTADYEPERVTRQQASKALRRTRGFVQAVETRESELP